jgi:hypothetical protein
MLVLIFLCHCAHICSGSRQASYPLVPGSLHSRVKRPELEAGAVPPVSHNSNGVVLNHLTSWWLPKLPPGLSMASLHFVHMVYLYIPHSDCLSIVYQWDPCILSTWYIYIFRTVIVSSRSSRRTAFLIKVHCVLCEMLSLCVHCRLFVVCRVGRVVTQTVGQTPTTEARIRYQVIACDIVDVQIGILLHLRYAFILWTFWPSQHITAILAAASPILYFQFLHIIYYIIFPSVIWFF